MGPSFHCRAAVSGVDYHDFRDGALRTTGGVEHTRAGRAARGGWRGSTVARAVLFAGWERGALGAAA